MSGGVEMAFGRFAVVDCTSRSFICEQIWRVETYPAVWAFREGAQLTEPFTGNTGHPGTVAAYMAGLATSDVARDPIGHIGQALYVSARTKHDHAPHAKLTAFTTALGLRPMDADINNDLGVLLGTNFRKHRQALRRFYSAVQHEPTHPHAVANVKIARKNLRSLSRLHVMT